MACLAGVMVLYVILARTVHAPPGELARFRLETPAQPPQVTFEDSEGDQHRLEDFRGRYVLLNLWATWCAPCVNELPSLSRLSADMDPRRFVVIAVALPPGDVMSARQFLFEHGAGKLAAYFDRDTVFMRSFHAYALPLTVLIDPHGEEIGRAMGAQRWDAGAAIRYLVDLTGIEESTRMKRGSRASS